LAIANSLLFNVD